jgi:two-component system NtrC family sensor kinase
MSIASAAAPSRWELAAETIAVKIRWFGLVVGYVLVNAAQLEPAQRAILNAILALGVVYALCDTVLSFRGRVFLGRLPLLISSMEALFIGLLCYYHGGLESPFRYYYLLSLICCAIRHSSRVTYATCALHCASYSLLCLVLPAEQREPLQLLLMLVLLGWVTWAADAMAQLLKRVGEHLGRLNQALRENQGQLEARIAERTRELQEAQAHVLHQEKMAAFGLLAAGIAHEVGNPLTSISALVQLLQRRAADAYSLEKLGLVSGQLQRIQTTLRELVNFSRPASTERGRVSLKDVLQEALNIAKYYRLTAGGGRRATNGAQRSVAGDRQPIAVDVADDLPTILGVRDQLVQVFLNLILNAIDATAQGGHIEVTAQCHDGVVQVSVRDDGIGIAPEHLPRLFQPYFTTKQHGTGLGLFVTRELLTDHGGSIEVTSAPGRGTEFQVRLPAPMESAHSDLVAPGASSPLKKGTGPLRCREKPMFRAD